MRKLFKLIRNIINPKVKRPETCICPEDEFRFWHSYYKADCPNHGHHITQDN